jgi:hypothetical protein
MNTKQLVESFIRLSMQKDENADALRSLLARNFRYQSPMAEFRDADHFLERPWEARLQPRAIEIESFLGDDTQACVAYEMESLDPETGRISFTDWFKFEDGRISSVRSTFDAARLKENEFRI